MNLLRNLKIGIKLLVVMLSLTTLGIVGYFYNAHAMQVYRHGVNTDAVATQKAVDLSQAASFESNNMARFTLSYIFTRNPMDWDAKMKADDEAGKAFEVTRAVLQVLPHHEALLASANAAAEQDQKFCNPLEDAMLKMAKEGQTRKAQDMYKTQYLPARAKLETLVAALITQIKKYDGDADAL